MYNKSLVFHKKKCLKNQHDKLKQVISKLENEVSFLKDAQQQQNSQNNTNIVSNSHNNNNNNTNNTNSHNTTNNHNTTNINVNINNFGEENISYLQSKQYLEKLFREPFYGIERMNDTRCSF